MSIKTNIDNTYQREKDSKLGSPTNTRNIDFMQKNKVQEITKVIKLIKLISIKQK